MTFFRCKAFCVGYTGCRSRLQGMFSMSTATVRSVYECLSDPFLGFSALCTYLGPTSPKRVIGSLVLDVNYTGIPSSDWLMVGHTRRFLHHGRPDIFDAIRRLRVYLLITLWFSNSLSGRGSAPPDIIPAKTPGCLDLVRTTGTLRVEVECKLAEDFLFISTQGFDECNI